MTEAVYNLASEASQSCIDDLQSLLASTDWISLGENDSVSGYYKSLGDLELIKSIGIINYDVTTVCDYIMQVSRAQEWDEMLINSKTLHDFGDIKVLHQTYKAIWPVSNRDFIIALKKFSINDDFLISARSIDIQIPLQEDTVRGECITSGFYIKNIEDIACELTYCVCVDPKGQIPKQIVNIVARKQVENVNKVREAVKKSI